MTDPVPRVLVLAGPNGAGKSTTASRLLRDRFGIVTFVNADTIATGLSGFDPGASALAAGRLMLQRVHEVAAARDDFAFETTLASRSFAPWLRKLQRSGYRVLVVFLWLPDVALAVSRVRGRVRLGGHAVPDDIIRRRYTRGIVNFRTEYAALADSWWLYDNSGTRARLVANRHSGRLRVADRQAWQRFTQA